MLLWFETRQCKNLCVISEHSHRVFVLGR